MIADLFHALFLDPLSAPESFTAVKRKSPPLFSSPFVREIEIAVCVFFYGGEIG